MSRPIEKMSAKDLRQIVKEYQERAFPRWRLVDGQGMRRECGPVVQQIWFERLRSGEYRPAGGVRILVAPNSAVLHRFLNIHDRSVLPRQHDEKFDDVVKAMRREFVPSVDEPLDPANVLEALQAETSPTLHNAHAIAALAAFLGKDKIARKSCRRFYELLGDGELYDWQQRLKDFIDRLCVWIETGTCQEEQTRIMNEERRRLSLD